MTPDTTPFRPLAPFKLPADTRPARDLGERGHLAMLPVASLVIDGRYQREIRAGGRANILQMIEAFDWRRFGVLVVCSVGDGRYAVIDGQHRATAALMHPDINLVPAMVIEADVAAAAEAFASLNGKVTKITAGDVFHARVAAGEEFARQVADVAAGAGIKLLRTKATNGGWEPGETVAVAAVQTVVKLYGPSLTRRCLEALAQPRHAGNVRAAAILALTDIVAANPVWLDRDLVAIFGRVRLGDLINAASARATERRTTVRIVLLEMLERSMKAVDVQSDRAKLVEAGE